MYESVNWMTGIQCQDQCIWVLEGAVLDDQSLKSLGWPWQACTSTWAGSKWLPVVYYSSTQSAAGWMWFSKECNPNTEDHSKENPVPYSLKILSQLRGT